MNRYHWKYQMSKFSMLVIGTVRCQQIQMHQKHNILIWTLWKGLIILEPNVELDFDVSVSNCMLSTDSSKWNLMFGPFRSICPGEKNNCSVFFLGHFILGKVRTGSNGHRRNDVIDAADANDARPEKGKKSRLGKHLASRELSHLWLLAGAATLGQNYTCIGPNQ